MDRKFAMTRDARLSALHRGDFGEPPGASGYEPLPQDATPRSAFGMSPDDAPR